ncbi:hypothetical protein DNTS_020506 [Danionella cerebrum]|nr:hypothetical protein DNTS_020506 [Danionella translucida]
MCGIGSVVSRDCVGDLSTTCKPCPPATYMNEPNGLNRCFPCRNCAESQGLYIQRKCTTIQDTTCDVLDGYYCIDFSNSQCSLAVQHKICKPGQETITLGTKTSDTVCGDCRHGFFSQLGLNCTQWTNCEARNEIESEAGSSVKDTTCVRPSRNRCSVIASLLLLLVTVILITTKSLLYHSKRIKSQDLPLPTEETSPMNVPSSPEEDEEL